MTNLLQRCHSAFVGPYPDNLGKVMDEYLAVSHLSGQRGIADGLDNHAGIFVFDDHFDPRPGQTTHFIREAADLIQPSLLASPSLYCGNRHSGMASLAQGCAYVRNLR